MPVAEALIPVTDEGLIRGDGAFEVIRIYDGQPYAFDAHLARLSRSADNLRLPVDLELVRADTFRLLAEAGTGPDHQCLRIMITRGGRRILLTEPMVTLVDGTGAGVRYHHLFAEPDPGRDQVALLRRQHARRAAGARAGL